MNVHAADNQSRNWYRLERGREVPCTFAEMLAAAQAQREAIRIVDRAREVVDRSRGGGAK